jgi:hypothetical protein
VHKRWKLSKLSEAVDVDNSLRTEEVHTVSEVWPV